MSEQVIESMSGSPLIEQYRESSRLSQEKRREAADERDAFRAALAELVRLKDGPRDAAYRQQKDLAWGRARALLDTGAEDYMS